MFETTSSPSERRRVLREGLASDGLLRFPGAFNALSAVLVAEARFEGIYVSGAVISASLALPDIGLTSVTEVAGRAAEMARVTALPTLVDADTGFGEPLSAARTVQLLEDAGVSACHLEDQENPKRCGHLDGKRVVGRADMVRRLAAAVAARRDPDLVICARTDARALEGLDATIDRCKAYADAGADLIFPEALASAREFEAVASALDVPILANMTEFGRSELIDAATLANVGVRVVIYPVTLLRIAMGAVERGLRTLASEGHQRSLVAEMQTRARLYELLDYASYETFNCELIGAGETGNYRKETDQDG